MKRRTDEPTLEYLLAGCGIVSILAASQPPQSTSMAGDRANVSKATIEGLVQDVACPIQNLDSDATHFSLIIFVRQFKGSLHAGLTFPIVNTERLLTRSSLEGVSSLALLNPGIPRTALTVPEKDFVHARLRKSVHAQNLRRGFRAGRNAPHKPTYARRTTTVDTRPCLAKLSLPRQRSDRGLEMRQADPQLGATPLPVVAGSALPASASPPKRIPQPPGAGRVDGRAPIPDATTPALLPAFPDAAGRSGTQGRSYQRATPRS